MAITQNKLTPTLVVIAAVIVGYVLWMKHRTTSTPVPSGTPMATVPKLSGAASSPKDAKLPDVRSADADTPADTMTMLTQSNRELRGTVQQIIERNEYLEHELKKQKSNADDIADRVTGQVLERIGPRGSSVPPQPDANASVVPSPVAMLDSGIGAATRLINGLTSRQTPAGIPPGLGYEGAASGVASAPPAVQPVALTRTIAPLGYRVKTGQDGASSLERHALAQAPSQLALLNPEGLPATAAGNPEKPAAQPWFTIPENSTLTRSTAMTTLIGRVPIDGRVQDPIPFKLVVGRENLAASDQYVPDDIAGVIVSGIAIGDMALSCTEGVVQSLTLVFDDGTIRTVSQRRNGATANSGGGGLGAASGNSLAATAKLGWLSDEYGNPCIPGKFVTNALAYLADVIGAKSLSVAGAAIAAAETTTTAGASALGSATSTTVTGDKGRYVLGQAASSGSDEMVHWLMQRLNSSFDAVVVRAGTHVAVHIDQSIDIDKDPEGRRLDYGRSRLAVQEGMRHGLD